MLYNQTNTCIDVIARVRARVDARAAVNAKFHNVAVAWETVRPAATSAPSLTAAAPLKFTTKTKVAVAWEIVRSVRVAFLSAA